MGDPIDEGTVFDDTPVEEPTGKASSPSGEDTPNDPYEKRYKDLQAHTTRVEQENKTFRDSMARLEGRFEQFTSQNQQSEEAVDLFSDVDLDDIRDDPATIIDVIRQQEAMRGQQFVEMLEARDRAILAQIRLLAPDHDAIHSKVEELRSDPDFRGFGDEQLEVLARKQLKTTPKAAGVDPVSGGGGRRLPNGRRGEPSETDRETEAWMKRMGYDNVVVPKEKELS